MDVSPAQDLNLQQSVIALLEIVLDPHYRSTVMAMNSKNLKKKPFLPFFCTQKSSKVSFQYIFSLFASFRRTETKEYLVPTKISPEQSMLGLLAHSAPPHFKVVKL